MQTILKTNAYSCGSPIRLPVIEAIAAGANIKSIYANPNPQFIPGNSVVWGLIRGADLIMKETTKSGASFYHVDNAYFGRNLLYRVTLNNLQLSFLPNKIINNRYKEILKILNKDILPYKKHRDRSIVICPSTDFLYQYYGSSLQEWVACTIHEIKKNTDRPIKIRWKQTMPLDDIDQEISNAWCVVTHVSAAALDALRLGVPVITTGNCAASPLSNDINKIDYPELFEGREELFSYLALGQFSLDEMILQNVLKRSKEVLELQSLYSNP